MKIFFFLWQLNIVLDIVSYQGGRKKTRVVREHLCQNIVANCVVVWIYSTDDTKNNEIDKWALYAKSNRARIIRSKEWILVICYSISCLEKFEYTNISRTLCFKITYYFTFPCPRNDFYWVQGCNLYPVSWPNFQAANRKLTIDNPINV